MLGRGQHDDHDVTKNCCQLQQIPAVHGVMGAYIQGAQECLTITASFMNLVNLVGSPSKPPSIARLLACDCLGKACAAHAVYYTVLPASLTPNALNSSLTLLQEQVSDLLQTLHDAPAQRLAQERDADAVGGEVVLPGVGQVELQAVNGTLHHAHAH